ncbi:MAG: hypothetical protein AVDCRST_MAG79-785 [uncultured Thermoleophilia bacterium]|uniref:Uncharacterized protein n=1 Tax=uncultured Thermoleophilia bacterium TaxID=1497501 RepID=A0A6J4TQC5_9ACTN|nr:MAG: hypothetical protein AVDCRST_MAG79-785 [uncultured Thermoleophilia bacterium]
MGLLDNILGSGGDRQGLDDFVNRYEQGAPYDGISDDEALSQHDRFAQHLSDDEYREHAEQAVSRLGPDEQQQLGSFLSGRAQQQGVDVGGLLGGGGLGGMLGGGGGGGMNPAALAMLMSGLNGHGGQRGFGNILGGGGGGALGNPVA